MINAVYLDTVAQTARAAMSGTALPSITGKLLSHLPITGIFFAGEDVVTIDADTGKCVIKPKDAPAGTPSLIDTAAELVTVGAETHYLFEWASADSAELRAYLDAQADPSQPVEMRCEIEYAIGGETARIAFPILMQTSYTRPEDPAPSATSDTSWEWLKLRELAGSGIERTVDDTGKTLTWSAPGIATNATAIAAEATARGSADTTLQGNIDTEAATRAAVDGANSDAIIAEAIARGNADTTLQGNINTEATARADADNNLQSNINGKANTSHTHTLSNLTQSGATTGQVPVWSGTAWAPGSASFPRGHIAGLKLAYNSTTLLSIGEGVCRDESNSSNIVLASGLTRGITATWNVGNGGLQPGLTLTASRWYSVWALGAVGFSVGDVMFSDSATAPVIPLPYNTRRRIGWIWVNASSQITPFLQVGEQVTLNTGNTTADVIIAMSGVDTLITLPAPPNTDVMLRAWSSATAGTYKIRIDPTFVSFPTTPVADTSTINGSAGTVGGNFHLNLMTDASSQIHAINSGGSSLNLRLTVRGWIDNRGRFD